MKNISRFHFLSQDVEGISHAQLVQEACEAGTRWIQLRVKNKNYEEWISIAREVKTVTDNFNATLIINDNLEIAAAINAHGVHLGQKDFSVRQARKILGNDFIIGGSTNSFEQILEMKNAGADYVGLGPFRFTSTKKNLNPVLGLEKISKIIFRLKENKIEIPVIAIGGITENDVDVLMNAGVFGVAVSSAVNFSKNKKETVKTFLKSTELTFA